MLILGEVRLFARATHGTVELGVARLPSYSTVWPLLLLPTVVFIKGALHTNASQTTPACVSPGESCENGDLIQQVWDKPEICISNKLPGGAKLLCLTALSNQAVDDGVVCTHCPLQLIFIIRGGAFFSLCMDSKLVVILYQVLDLLQSCALR